VLDPNLTGRARVEAALALLQITAEIVSPGKPMPTVPLAAEAVGCAPEQIIKTVVFVTPDDLPVVAIANGTGRIDRSLLAAAIGVALVKLAGPDFVMAHTGYSAGGVSPIGIRSTRAPIIVDSDVLNQQSVYGGAGTEDDLLRINTDDLIAVTGGRVCSITRRE
jgi:Cys-tRNA(Pro) deacylase